MKRPKKIKTKQENTGVNTLFVCSRGIVGFSGEKRAAQRRSVFFRHGLRGHITPFSSVDSTRLPQSSFCLLFSVPFPVFSSLEFTDTPHQRIIVNNP